MEKLLTYPGKTEKGIFSFVIDAERNFLEKTAAEYNPTIAAYIHDAKPIKGKMQILLTALGAGEFWGNNVNGDYFPESEIAYAGPEYGHKTFETMAKIYKHHINKDPNRSYGDVKLAVYNPVYHRVELIVLVDMVKGMDIAQRMEDGDYPDWSMGCRVPFDVCVVCKNKAPTRKHYCEHAKYYLNKIWPATGQMVYVINYRPKFHDISQVLIGADRIAKTLMKVASTKSYHLMGSAYAAEKYAAKDGLLVPERLAKQSSEKKIATIEKEVPADEPPASLEDVKHLANTIMEVKSREEAFPDEVIDKLGKKPLPQVMSTLATLGILPKPHEFQRIVLISIGRKSLADELHEKQMCFDPSDGEANDEYEHMLKMSPNNFSPAILNILRPFMGERSYYQPHLGRRLTVLIKRAAQEEPNYVKVDNRKPFPLAPLLLATAGLYATFGKKAPEMAEGIDKLVLKHPMLSAALGISLVNTFKTMFGAGLKGTTYRGPAPSDPDVPNIEARLERWRAKPLEKMAMPKISPIKALIIGAPLAHMTSGYLQRRRELKPYEQEGMLRRFVRNYPDVITAALAANALFSGKRKKTFGMPKAAQEGYFDVAKSWLSEHVSSESAKLLKEATAQDFLMSGLIVPTVLGKANLPARVVGGLFDQAVLEAGSKMLSKKKKPSAEYEPVEIAKAAGFYVNPWDLIKFGR